MAQNETSTAPNTSVPADSQEVIIEQEIENAQYKRSLTYLETIPEENEVIIVIESDDDDDNDVPMDCNKNTRIDIIYISSDDDDTDTLL